MRRFATMFCHAGPSSLVFFFFRDVKFSRTVIYRLKKLKLHWLWRTALWLSQNCCLVLYVNCRVSCYKSSLVVCAVARTVSHFVQLSFDLHWSFGFIEDFTINAVQAFQNTKKKIFGFHTRASKVHYRSSEGQTFYWSIITADDSIKFRHEKPSGRFSKSRGLSASVSFLSSPPPPRCFTCAIFPAVFHSPSSFFSRKPHRDACYAG